jgi:hypothetical protein
MIELELLPNTNITKGLEAQFTQIQNDLRNLRTSPNPVGGFDRWLDDYLQWIEQADWQLRSHKTITCTISTYELDLADGCRCVDHRSLQGS